MLVLTNARVIPWEAAQQTGIIHIESPSLVTCTATVNFHYGQVHGVLHKGQTLFLYPPCFLELIHTPVSAFTIYHIGLLEYGLTKETHEKRVYELTSENLPAHGSKTGTSSQGLRILAIIQELTDKRSGSIQTKEARSHFLLSELLELFKLAVKPATEMVDSAIRDAIYYINDHYGDHITREDIARMTGFNASYFSRFFKNRWDAASRLI